jgi:hypothetical protein
MFYREDVIPPFNRITDLGAAVNGQICRDTAAPGPTAFLSGHPETGIGGARVFLRIQRYSILLLRSLRWRICTPYQRVIDKGVPIKRSINHRGRSRSTSTTPRGT